MFQLTPNNTLEHIKTVELPGNALSSIAYISDNATRLVVSVDTIHKSGSTTERRDPHEDSIGPLLSYRFQNQEVIAGANFEVVDEEEEVDNDSALGRLGNLVYNLENLRKREGDAREED